MAQDKPNIDFLKSFLPPPQAPGSFGTEAIMQNLEAATAGNK